jgi:hypothetical protein
MKKIYKKVKLKTIKGMPVVNHAILYKKNKNIVLIYVDLQSKYCIIDALGSDYDNGPCIYIGINSGSLYLNTKLKKCCTLIYFPEFKGWDIFSANINKYTIAVTLLKNNSK